MFDHDSRAAEVPVLVAANEEFAECVFCQAPTEEAGHFTMASADRVESGALQRCTHCAQIYLMLTEDMPKPSDLVPIAGPALH